MALHERGITSPEKVKRKLRKFVARCKRSHKNRCLELWIPESVDVAHSALYRWPVEINNILGRSMDVKAMPDGMVDYQWSTRALRFYYGHETKTIANSRVANGKMRVLRFWCVTMYTHVVCGHE